MDLDETLETYFMIAEAYGLIGDAPYDIQISWARGFPSTLR